MNNKQLEEHKQKREKQVQAFKECFSTPQGIVALASLRAEFYDVQLEPDTTLQFKAGQRDVVYQILIILGEIK